MLATPQHQNLPEPPPIKVKDRLSKMKAILSFIIENWERSGQGDGGRIDEDDEDEEDSSVEGVATARKLSDDVVASSANEVPSVIRTTGRASRGTSVNINDDMTFFMQGFKEIITETSKESTRQNAENKESSDRRPLTRPFRPKREYRKFIAVLAATAMRLGSILLTTEANNNKRGKMKLLLSDHDIMLMMLFT